MGRVLLLNTQATTGPLDVWMLADKNKRRHPLDGFTLKAGAVTTVTLRCTTIQGVQYNKNDVSEQGRTIVF